MEKIAFIVGAGAVENAWEPILELLGKDYDYPIDADSANCIFARLVYLMRFYATGTFDNAKLFSEEMIQHVDNIKVQIADALILAEKEGHIRARKEFKDILNRFIFSTTNKAVLINTNWDTVIDNAINIYGESNYPKIGSKISSLHFHGSVKESKLIYLPSEIVREPYRSDEDDQSLGNLHGSVWQTIGLCTKTILYGLSIDPLDAELSQTLMAGWSSKNLKEIIIIDPNHKKVAQRVKLLLDKRYPVKIIAYSPSDLDYKFEY